MDAAPEGRVSDQQIRHVDAGGHNVGVGIVPRPPTTSLSAIQHHQQTEVYYVLAGSGTLVTAATITNGRELDPQGATVRTLTGPSAMETIEGGVSQHVSAGDVLIIPARGSRLQRDHGDDHLHGSPVGPGQVLELK